MPTVFNSGVVIRILPVPIQGFFDVCLVEGNVGMANKFLHSVYTNILFQT